MRATCLPGLTLGAALVLAAPAAAAATPAPAPTASVRTSTTAESADQQARDRLNELVTIRTQAQIQEILDSDQAAELLYGVEVGKCLAAHATGRAVPELSLDPFTAPAE